MEVPVKIGPRVRGDLGWKWMFDSSLHVFWKKAQDALRATLSNSTIVGFDNHLRKPVTVALVRLPREVVLAARARIVLRRATCVCAVGMGRQSVRSGVG